MPPTSSESTELPAPEHAAFTPPAAEKLLRLPAVLDLTGRGRTATLDDVKAGRFPKPIKVGTVSAWLASEVQAWIAARVRDSRKGGR